MTAEHIPMTAACCTRFIPERRTACQPPLRCTQSHTYVRKERAMLLRKDPSLNTNVVKSCVINTVTHVTVDHVSMQSTRATKVLNYSQISI